MPYTLMKGLLWILAAGAIGLVVGWLLRSVAAKRQIDRARETRLGTAEHDELTRLRSRVANLEPVVNERDRLRAELDTMRRERTSATTAPATVAPVVSDVASVPDAPVPSEPNASAPAASTDTIIGGTEVDVTAAAAVIGKRIDVDDLTVIEGIGPKIAELCHGIGIRTWSDLADTEVSLLKTMLTDAGQRFKAHDPTTWPQQAQLLASGAWSDFRALTDRLDGGRAVD